MIKEEQIDKYQIPLRDGKMIGAIAMTEPGGGSDLQGIRTNAVRNHFYLNFNTLPSAGLHGRIFVHLSTSVHMSTCPPPSKFLMVRRPIRP